MTVFECIKQRRSIRKYDSKHLKKSEIEKLIESAIWAPSGKNIQPWCFYIINNNKEKLDLLAEQSLFGYWIKSAPCIIVVFLDMKKSYDYLKDVQAIGAAIQNILLVAHSIGLGTCWVGEIVKNEFSIKKLLEIDNVDLKLMAAVTVGYPQKKITESKRNNLIDSIIGWD